MTLWHLGGSRLAVDFHKILYIYLFDVNGLEHALGITACSWRETSQGPAMDCRPQQSMPDDVFLNRHKTGAHTT